MASGPSPDPGVTAQPSHLVATASGSGVILTWIGPPGATPVRYAISGGTAPGTSTLPVIVTADASSRYLIPTVPPGSYYFTVVAILADGLSARRAKPLSWPAVLNPPAARQVALLPSSRGGTSPPPGHPRQESWRCMTSKSAARPARQKAVLTTTETSVTYRAGAGRCYLRVREVRGATVSAPSNEVSVWAATACAAAPLIPVLLPVSTLNDETTFSWLSAAGPSAARYVWTWRALPVPCR